MYGKKRKTRDGGKRDANHTKKGMEGEREPPIMKKKRKLSKEGQRIMRNCTKERHTLEERRTIRGSKNGDEILLVKRRNRHYKTKDGGPEPRRQGKKGKECRENLHKESLVTFNKKRGRVRYQSRRWKKEMQSDSTGLR